MYWGDFEVEGVMDWCAEFCRASKSHFKAFKKATVGDMNSLV